jgi:hypothetical protein
MSNSLQQSTVETKKRSSVDVVSQDDDPDIQEPASKKQK